MTIEEKIIEFNKGIAPDVAEDTIVEAMLLDAEAMILNKMYPFGYPEGAIIPSRYERLQLSLAVELYNQRGAEGQSSHSENGTSRTWPSVSRILSQIAPHCGSVISNA